MKIQVSCPAAEGEDRETLDDMPRLSIELPDVTMS
jgi:hypothetical protein